MAPRPVGVIVATSVLPVARPLVSVGEGRE